MRGTAHSDKTDDGSRQLHNVTADYQSSFGLSAGMDFLFFSSPSQTFLQKDMQSVRQTLNYDSNQRINRWLFYANPVSYTHLDVYKRQDWCGPCKMVAPILDELAKEYDGQIVIYKVDTEKEQELAGAFGIRSIPSILFIPMEGKPEMAQGAMPKASFKKAIDEFLLKK